MPPRKRPRNQDASYGTVTSPVFSRASVLDNGLIGEKPANKRSLTQERGYPPPDEAAEDLYALNSLQLRRDRPIEPGSLIYPVFYLLDSLPRALKRRVRTWQPGIEEVFNCPQSDFQVNAGKEYWSTRTFWNAVKSSEYFIWPIQAEIGRYVTAIFHLRKGLVNDPNFDPDDSEASNDGAKDVPQVMSDEYFIIDAWSVVDAVRSNEAIQRVNRVRNRLQQLFKPEGIVFRPGSYQKHKTATERWSLPWVPPQTDDWSSGLRSFALIRQILQRIIDFYCTETAHNNSLFNEPTSGWLNVDQVRHEMMGYCAMNCIEDMDYNARIAIEAIDEINSIAGIRRIAARRLAPNNNNKSAWVPHSDKNGVPKKPTVVNSNVVNIANSGAGQSSPASSPPQSSHASTPSGAGSPNPVSPGIPQHSGGASGANSPPASASPSPAPAWTPPLPFAASSPSSSSASPF
ncbi:hypothetical protein F4810DRAFT_720149 [Camillea tinctor]|nr:hypothetical protein F4810DRAFT_720149 [Camillea tinctor]